MIALLHYPIPTVGIMSKRKNARMKTHLRRLSANLSNGLPRDSEAFGRLRIGAAQDFEFLWLTPQIDLLEKPLGTHRSLNQLHVSCRYLVRSEDSAKGQKGIGQKSRRSRRTEECKETTINDLTFF